MSNLVPAPIFVKKSTHYLHVYTPGRLNPDYYATAVSIAYLKTQLKNISIQIIC